MAVRRAPRMEGMKEWMKVQKPELLQSAMSYSLSSMPQSLRSVFICVTARAKSRPPGASLGRRTSSRLASTARCALRYGVSVGHQLGLILHARLDLERSLEMAPRKGVIPAACLTTEVGTPAGMLAR